MNQGTTEGAGLLPEMAGLDEGAPLFVQIAERLAEDIADGSLAEGERVPSTNELAAFYRINPATAAKGISMLTDDGRDFTCNAIALSLNRTSRGLLLDPMNGLADIERKELRAISTYGFYDDPSRLLRLVRFRVRLNFTVEERTEMQVSNAREAEVEKLIPARTLAEELKRISAEDSPSEVLKGLEEAGLLALFSPALAGPKVNLPGIVKFEKNCRMLPDDTATRAARLGPFLWALTEKLTARKSRR